MLTLSPKHQDIVNKIDDLVATKIAPRASRYDANYQEPREDIEDLWEAGLLLANISTKYGGLGYGIDAGDPLAFYLCIERLAYGNPSTAHCFQVHNHTMQMVEVMATDEQRERWLEPTIKRGALLTAAGSIPRGQNATVARKVKGGYLLNGVKHYATNATMAEWFEITAILEESGLPIRFMIHHTDEGLRVDASGWKPVGMRACVSPVVYIDNCFLTEDNILGNVADRENSGSWLGKFHVAFASNYLGSAEFMYDWILRYLQEREDSKKLLPKVKIGELKTMLDASKLLVYEAAEQLSRTDRMRGMLLGNEAKWMAKKTLQKLIATGGEIVGSSAMFESYPLERYFRDMHVHMLHSRIDVAAELVGSAELGETFDINRER